MEEESAKNNKHVNFNSDTEIRYRTASEDSSISNISNKNTRKFADKNKDINTGYNSNQNHHTCINGSKQKDVKNMATESKLDIFVNGKCSWSYKSLKTIKSNSVRESGINKRSTLETQKFETSICVLENIPTSNLNVPSKSSTEELDCSDESVQMNSPNKFQIEKVNKINDCSYDFDELDSKRKTKTTIKKENKKSKPQSKSKESRSLRNKKRVNYSELDIESDSSDGLPKNKLNKSVINTGENNGNYTESFDDDISSCSDEGLIFQTRFSDKNVKVADVANSIDSYSAESNEILNSETEQHVTTTPFVLKLSSKNNDKNEQNINELSITHPHNSVKGHSKYESEDVMTDKNSDYVDNFEVIDKTYNLAKKSCEENILDEQVCSNEEDIDLEIEINKRCNVISKEINSTYNDLKTAMHSLNHLNNSASEDSTSHENIDEYFNKQELLDIPAATNNKFQNNNDKSKIERRNIEQFKLGEMNNSNVKTNGNSLSNEKEKNNEIHSKSSVGVQLKNKKSTLKNNETKMKTSMKHKLDSPSLDTDPENSSSKFNTRKNKMDKSIEPNNYKDNIELKELFMNFQKSKENSNMNSDTEDYMSSTSPKHLRGKYQNQNAVLKTIKSKTDLNASATSDQNDSNETVAMPEILSEVSSFFVPQNKEEKNKFQNIKRNERNSSNSKTLNLGYEGGNKTFSTEKNSKEGIISEVKKSNMNSSVGETEHIPSSSGFSNKHIDLDKPKTWDELEAVLLSDEDKNLSQGLYQNKEKFKSFEMYDSSVETKKNIKKINKCRKQEKSIDISYTYNFEHKTTEVINNKQILTMNSQIYVRNKYQQPSDYNQLSEANSPNINIVNKAIAAMERCTAGYLSMYKDGSQKSVQYGEINIIGESNSPIRNKKEINIGNKTKKQLQLKKYSKDKAKNTNSNQKVRSSNIANENGVNFNNSEKNQNLKKIKSKNNNCNGAKNIPEFNFDANKINTSSECSEEKILFVKEKYNFEIQNGNELDGNLASSEESLQNKQTNSVSKNNFENPYNLRKRNHDIMIETVDKKINRKKFRGDQQSKNNKQNLNTRGEMLNDNLKSNHLKTHSQKFKNTKVFTNKNTLCEKNDILNDSSTNTTDDNASDVDLRTINKFQRTSNGSKLANLDEILDSKTNTKQQRVHKKKENSLQKQKSTTNTLSFNERKINNTKDTRDCYIKYLENLFKKGITSEDKTNNSHEEGKFIEKSDDLFSISSDDSELDGTEYNSEASQSQHSNLFYDTLSEEW